MVMMAEENQQQKAAVSLIDQFMNAGLVQQEDDGSFILPESQSK